MQWVNSQHCILSGRSQFPFTQTLSFPHLQKKKKKIVLFYGLVAHYISTT